jgi:hypothetical protein
MQLNNIRKVIVFLGPLVSLREDHKLAGGINTILLAGFDP